MIGGLPPRMCLEKKLSSKNWGSITATCGRCEVKSPPSDWCFVWLLLLLLLWKIILLFEFESPFLFGHCSSLRVSSNIYSSILRRRRLLSPPFCVSFLDTSPKWMRSIYFLISLHTTQHQSFYGSHEILDFNAGSIIRFSSAAKWEGWN